MVAVPSRFVLLISVLCVCAAMACSLAGGNPPDNPPGVPISSAELKDASSLCASLTSCRTCTSQNACGWCASSGECMHGSAQGPIDKKQFSLPLARDFDPSNDETTNELKAMNKHTCDAQSWVWLASVCASTPTFSNSSSESTCVLTCAPSAAKYKQGDSCGAGSLMRRNKDNWCKVNGTDYCCDKCCELTDGAIACIVILVLVFVFAVTGVCVWCCVRSMCGGAGVRSRYENAAADTSGNSRGSRRSRRESRLQRVGVIPSSDAPVHPIQAVATPATVTASRIYPAPDSTTAEVYRI